MATTRDLGHLPCALHDVLGRRLGRGARLGRQLLAGLRGTPELDCYAPILDTQGVVLDPLQQYLAVFRVERDLFLIV